MPLVADPTGTGYRLLRSCPDSFTGDVVGIEAGAGVELVKGRVALYGSECVHVPIQPGGGTDEGQKILHSSTGYMSMFLVVF